MSLVDRILALGAAMVVRLKTKADLVDGKVPLNQLQDATLSEEQFEQLPNGKLWLRTDYLQSLGLGGGSAIPVAITKQPQSQNLTVGDTMVLEVDFSGPGALTWQGSSDGGLTFPHENGSNKVITIPSAQTSDAGYYRARIDYDGGFIYSNVAVITVQAATEEPSAGNYTVENTYLVNFGSEYADFPLASYFNTLKPSSSLLTANGGYTSPFLVNGTGVAGTIKLTNTGAFAGAAGQISGEQDAAGDTGVFPNGAINTAWTINGGTNAALTLSGLKGDKFYQMYFLMPTGADNSVRGVTIGGVTKNRTATTSLGSFGLAANGLNDPEWIVFNNLTGSSIVAEIKRVSGDWGAALAMIVIEESNIAKP